MVGQHPHGHTDIGHLKAGGGLVIDLFAYIGYRPPADGLGQILLLESGPLADKETAGHGGAGVAGHRRNNMGQVAGEGGGFVHQQLQFVEKLVIASQRQAGTVHKSTSIL